MSQGFVALISARVSETAIDEGFATFLNPSSYLRLRRIPKLIEHLNAIYFDGIMMVWAFRMIGIRVRRTSMDMTSLAPTVLRKAEQERSRVGFVGATTEELEDAANLLLSKFPRLSLAYANHGWFPSSQNLEIVQRLIESEVQVLLVGMGAPRQEEFLLCLRHAGWSGTAYTCGAFFTQTSMTADGHYYPSWANRMHLRWVIRCMREPHTIRRYLLDYPRFLTVFLWDSRGTKGRLA